jgi:3-methyladenine DNA glycosylase Tag
MVVSAFQPILDRALSRHGEQAIQARLPEVKTPDDLAALPDDRYLSLMSLRIFRAGLKHSVVDARWSAFEEAFHGFDPRRIRAMPDDEMDALLGDTRLIRHGGKLRSVRDNAARMIELRDERGGMGRHLADWPVDDSIGLWADLGKRFSQMGGNSAPYFLRMAGRDTFLLSDSVVRGLIEAGALDGAPKNVGGRRAAQEQFNAWAEETGRPLAHLSMILALATD